MKVVFDARAVTDLEAIHQFIAAYSPDSARAVVDRIVESVERLGAFPSMGRSGLVEGTREWVIPRLPYIAVYRVDRACGEVIVVGVFHGAQERKAE